MFAKILLKSTKACVEFIGFGECSPIRFSVIGPTSETDFFDELLEEEFGSLKIDPDDLLISCHLTNLFNQNLKFRNGFSNSI